MTKVNFYDLNTIEDSKLLFAVVMAKFNGQWIYVRHRTRRTWEIPGGHREKNENIKDTASRELYEETGATKFTLTPVCIYSVQRSKDTAGEESFGQLFYSEVEVLNGLPDFEITEIKFCDRAPDGLTYPLIQPLLHNKVLDFLEKACL